jgi:hypothetical protein
VWRGRLVVCRFVACGKKVLGWFDTQNADIGIFCPRDRKIRDNEVGSPAPSLEWDAYRSAMFSQQEASGR